MLYSHSVSVKELLQFQTPRIFTPFKLNGRRQKLGDNEKKEMVQVRVKKGKRKAGGKWKMR